MVNSPYFRLYDVSDNAEEHKNEYLFDNVLLRKGISVIVGKTGAGKSLTTMRIAAALATGQPIGYPKRTGEDWPATLGMPPHRGATLYFGGEGQSGMRSRIIAARDALPASALDSLPAAFNGQLPIICLGKTSRPLVRDEQIYFIKQAIKERSQFFAEHGYLIRLMVFDTLVSSFFIRDENNNSEMQDLVNTLGIFQTAFDCHIMATAHPSKSSQSKGETRGASAVVNSADTVLDLQAAGKSDERSLTVTKIRDGAGEGAVFNFSLEKQNGVPALVPIQHDNEKVSHFDNEVPLFRIAHSVLNAVEASLEDGYATKERVFEEMIAKDVVERAAINKEPSRRDTIRKRLIRGTETLVESGKIYLHSDGKHDIYTLPIVYSEEELKRFEELRYLFMGVNIEPPPQ
jgi:hypothetical protein